MVTTSSLIIDLIISWKFARKFLIIGLWWKFTRSSVIIDLSFIWKFYKKLCNHWLDFHPRPSSEKYVPVSYARSTSNQRNVPINATVLKQHLTNNENSNSTAANVSELPLSKETIEAVTTFCFPGMFLMIKKNKYYIQKLFSGQNI